MKNPFDFFEEIYCINMKEDVSMWKHFLTQAKKVNIENRIIKIDGINHEIGFVGNMLSHKYIINKAYSEGKKNILILEDDVEWRDDVISKLNNSIESLKQQPSWDMFFLGIGFNAADSNHVPTYFGDNNLIKLNNGFFIHAYAINLSDDLVEYINEFGYADKNSGFDNFYGNEIFPIYNCYATSPPLAYQKKRKSRTFNHYMNYTPMQILSFRRMLRQAKKNARK